MKKKLFIAACIISMTVSSLYAYRTTMHSNGIFNLSFTDVEYYSDSEGIRGAIDCKKNCNGDFWGRCYKATVNGVQVTKCEDTTSGANCCGIETVIEEY